MRLFHAARARLRLMFARRDAESRMDEEFRFHVDMEAERLTREEGLAPQEARRRAVIAFGLAERHRDVMRDGRGFAWASGLSLDLKLGFRMLVKYPGLTVVGGFAMAFAVWAGAVAFQVVMLFVSPTLPLPGGDRIVHLRNWDVQVNEKEPRVLHDFFLWRQSMRSVTDFGAWQDVARNVTGRDGEPRPVQLAAISASGFRVASARPLLGRVIQPADERADAPPVVLLGHELWRTRFGADSAIVGQAVRLGGVYTTVVGVMPAGFTFPVAHDAWTPFRPTALDDAPRRGPAVTIFGRLAPGATLDEAQVELATLGRRSARELPVTHAHLQPQIMPFAQIMGAPSVEQGGILALTQLFALMLLVLVCGNVALLLFARAAARESEIIVRSALGASRRRIVTQLFVEALVLGAVAAAVGLVGAQVALRQWALPFLKLNFEQLPFWFDPRVTPATVLYVCLLTIVGAAIAGGLPGLKVTRGIGTRLRANTSGGGGGLQFGGVWTAVIVAQVAVTVAFPGILLVEAREQQRVRSYDVGFAADRYLTMKLDLDTAPGVDTAGGAAAASAHRARLGMLVDALRQRLAAEPGVAGVTFVDQLPRTNYDFHRIGFDDPASAASGARQPRSYTKVAFVDPSYFEVLEAPILAGRGFQAADLVPDARVAIVDQGFVDQALLGRNPIGRRVRIAAGDVEPDGPGADSLPWLEIVGVVKNLGMIGAAETTRAIGLYRPAAPGSDFAPQMMIHTRGDPIALVPRVRAIAGALDPTLRLSEIRRADQVADDLLWILGLWLRTTLGVTAVALVLSLAGIYAVLSFTVVRRTREIGVRVALGASRRAVLVAIFRRPLAQVGVGIASGAVLIALGALGLARTYQFQDWPKGLSAGQVALLVVYAACMLGVCLLACVVPTRRALGVEPVVAMRVD